MSKHNRQKTTAYGLSSDELAVFSAKLGDRLTVFFSKGTAVQPNYAVRLVKTGGSRIEMSRDEARTLLQALIREFPLDALAGT